VGSFYGFSQSYINESSVRALIPLLALGIVRDRLPHEIDRKNSSGSNTNRALERWREEKGTGFIPSWPCVAGVAKEPVIVGAALMLRAVELRVAAAGR
jgi:hypothetical protein